MTRIWGSIHSLRFFIAAGVLGAAAAIIFQPVWSQKPAPAALVPKASFDVQPGIEALIKEAADAEAQGRFSEAIGAYEKVLVQDPGLTLAYLKLGQIFFRIGLPTKAEEAYLNAVDKGLSAPDVFLYLGYIRETKGELEQALGYYSKAELAGSKNPVLYFNMGNVQARLGSNAKALDHFKRAVVLEPRYKDAFVNLAIVSAQAGEFADAQYYLEKAEKLGYDAPVQFKSDLVKQLKKP